MKDLWTGIDDKDEAINNVAWKWGEWQNDLGIGSEVGGWAMSRAEEAELNFKNAREQLKRDYNIDMDDQEIEDHYWKLEYSHTHEEREGKIKL